MGPPGTLRDGESTSSMAHLIFLIPQAFGAKYGEWGGGEGVESNAT